MAKKPYRVVWLRVLLDESEYQAYREEAKRNKESLKSFLLGCLNEGIEDWSVRGAHDAPEEE